MYFSIFISMRSLGSGLRSKFIKQVKLQEEGIKGDEEGNGRRVMGAASQAARW